MSKVMSLRLRDDQVERLQRAARALGRAPSETAALLLEEALREREFAFLEFRDSPVGRQAYSTGTRLAIWQVVSLVRDYDGDIDAVATHLMIPVNRVQAALTYAEAYPDEIELAIQDNDRTPEELRRLYPSLTITTVSDAPAAR